MEMPISETNTNSTMATASTADLASITVEDYVGMSSDKEADPLRDIIEELGIENIGNTNGRVGSNDDKKI